MALRLVVFFFLLGLGQGEYIIRIPLYLCQLMSRVIMNKLSNENKMLQNLFKVPNSTVAPS